VPETGVEALASEVAGQDLSPLFNIWVRSTEELPLQEMLATVGIECCFRAAELQLDPGGLPGKLPPGNTRADLGVQACLTTPQPELLAVYHGGAAHRAGLSAGDVLVALDGLKLSGANFEMRLQRYAPGDEVRIHAFRRDELLTLTVALQAAEKTTCYLRQDAQADGACVKQRAAWFSGTAEL
jgi:predicted metalloprotease with PDZ domain